MHLLSPCCLRLFLFALISLFVSSVRAAGDTWEWSNPLPQGNPLQSVIRGDGLYVATGANGTLLSSRDGKTWSQEFTGTSGQLFGSCWNGQRYIVVGESGTVLSSLNGHDWVHQTSGSDKTLIAVIWNGRKFIAVGDKGTVITSLDGHKWYPQQSGTDSILSST